LQQNQTEKTASNRMNKGEPFQTKIYDSDKKRQQHNNTQQNTTKINKEILRYTKRGKNKQEIARKYL
jgi:DNA-binding NarL/FixJ family response regulator